MNTPNAHRGRLPGLLREPLVHFVVAALAAFVAWHVIQDGRSRADSTIRITRGDVERLAALYASESGALPSQEDMAAMLTDFVRDEALAREARRLGLDAGDTIVNRRLAQKMTFMVEDLAEETTPSEDVLRAWLDAHPDRFTDPQMATFSHVFFSVDLRGARADMDARIALSALNSGAADWKGTGDAFMLQRTYGDLPIREAARIFGTEFAAALADLPVSDEWVGPVQSSLGLHLVRVTAASPARLRPFEEARDAVLADWREETRRAGNDAAIQKIIGRYKVEIEDGDAR